MKKTVISEVECATAGTRLCFPQGILGFEDVTQYMLRRKELGPVWELRPEKGCHPRFLLFEADSVADCYCPALPQSALKLLRAADPCELAFFAVAVVPADIAETTVNLRSPIAVNLGAGLAAQVVLEDTGYPMRHPVFPGERGRP